MDGFNYRGAENTVGDLVFIFAFGFGAYDRDRLGELASHNTRVRTRSKCGSGMHLDGRRGFERGKRVGARGGGGS